MENLYYKEKSSTENSKSKGILTGTTSVTKVKPEPQEEVKPSINDETHEEYMISQDGHAQKLTYTVGPILHNVTLKLGIKAGTFESRGRQKNMTECIKSCGKTVSCDLAFMLGKQCFSVSCSKGQEFCQTKSAYSQYYNPQIAFVKHRHLYKGKRILMYVHY